MNLRYYNTLLYFFLICTNRYIYSYIIITSGTLCGRAALVVYACAYANNTSYSCGVYSAFTPSYETAKFETHRERKNHLFADARRCCRLTVL